MILYSETTTAVAHDGRDIVFVHGFTQTARSWQPVVSSLKHQFTCIALDAPGHGDSGDGIRSLPQCGDDIFESSPAGSALVGYSMGARMALHAVLQHPTHFSALVLISGTPGITDDTERNARRAADNVLAEHIEEIGTEIFIDEWLSNPMFAGLSPAMCMKSDRRRNSAAGLANSLRNSGTGTQNPLWNHLPEVTIPTLLVTGDNDKKFTEIASQMNSAMPTSSWMRVANVGHTAHLEDSTSFNSLLTDFLIVTSER